MSYTIGGPDDETTGRIEGTGARSITIEDINKLAGINNEDDYKALDSNYGSTTNPTVAVYYPILNSTNTTYPGQSINKKSNLMHTAFKSDYT